MLGCRGAPALPSRNARFNARQSSPVRSSDICRPQASQLARSHSTTSLDGHCVINLIGAIIPRPAQHIVVPSTLQFSGIVGGGGDSLYFPLSPTRLLTLPGYFCSVLLQAGGIPTSSVLLPLSSAVLSLPVAIPVLPAHERA